MHSVFFLVLMLGFAAISRGERELKVSFLSFFPAAAGSSLQGRSNTGKSVWDTRKSLNDISLDTSKGSKSFTFNKFVTKYELHTLHNCLRQWPRRSPLMIGK